MIRKPYPGSYSADCNPSGEFVVVFKNGKLASSLGELERPILPNGQREDLLFPRIKHGKIAGKGHTSDNVRLFQNGEWSTLTPALGNNSVIFDLNGTLHIADPSIGVQGYRYVSDANRLVTGDETSNDSTLLARELGITKMWQWCRVGDLTIGQGLRDWCVVVLPDGRRKVLEAHPSWFIKASRFGDTYAIALTYMDQEFSAIFFVERREFESLPDEPPLDPGNGGGTGGGNGGNGGNNGGDVTMNLPHEVFLTISAFYEKFGVPGGEEEQRAHQGRCCETVRARHGEKWGWKRADPGRPPSADAIAFFDAPKMFIWDCVSDAGGPNRRFSLVDNSPGLDVSNQVFIPVNPVDHLADTPPPPPPTDPEVSREEFEALQENVRQLRVALESHSHPEPDLSRFVEKGTEITVSGTYSDRGVFNTATKNIELKGRL